MKHFILITILALSSVLLPTASAAPVKSAAKPLKVVTTTPELAWFAQTIGGDRVEASSLAKGKENLHGLKITPRIVVAVAKADVFFENGLSLESTWLPDLILKSRNKKLRPSSIGRVNCSDGWTPIEFPSTLSRQNGDVHPAGNPHFGISPNSGRFIADRVLAGLVLNDPAGKPVYEKNHAALVKRIDTAMERWQRYIPLFKDKQCVMYHLEFDYMADFLGINILASIEPKPGLPPTPAHLAEVINVMNENGNPPILVATWSNNRASKSVAEKTGAKLLELPSMMHGEPYATDWIKMIDGMLESVRKAYGLPEVPTKAMSAAQ